MSQFLKDPGATLDFGVDWSEWLDENEVIAESAWAVPAGLTLASHGHTDTLAVAWLAGGTAGQTHTVANRITTSAGRTDERSMTIKVVER